MVGLLPLCAATIFDGATAREVPRDRRAVPAVPRRASGAAAGHPRPDASPASPAAGSPPSSTRPSSAACWPRCSTRTSSSARTASARCRATTPTIRTSSTSGGQEYRVSYLPAESDTGMFGGNSNWRGPIWMPVNALIIRALLQYYLYYGDDFTVECPDRLRPADEPVPGGRGDHAPAVRHLPARTRTAAARSTAATAKFQEDPHWRDLPAVLRVLPRRQRRRPRCQPPDRLDRRHRPPMHLFATLTPERALEGGKKSYFAARDRADVIDRPAVVSIPPRTGTLEGHGGAGMNASDPIAAPNVTTP